LVLAISSKVRGFSGCHHLEILFDIHHPGRVVTYSHWDDEHALNAYRDSEIFKTFWASIKPMFAEPAVARSMEISRSLP
jgi:quinol monooxygenase YgiN